MTEIDLWNGNKPTWDDPTVSWDDAKKAAAKFAAEATEVAFGLLWARAKPWADYFSPPANELTVEQLQYLRLLHTEHESELALLADFVFENSTAPADALWIKAGALGLHPFLPWSEQLPKLRLAYTMFQQSLISYLNAHRSVFATTVVPDPAAPRAFSQADLEGTPFELLPDALAPSAHAPGAAEEAAKVMLVQTVGEQPKEPEQPQEPEPAPEQPDPAPAKPARKKA
jgi:hypothetical protein